MIKTDVVSQISKKTGLEKRDVKEVVEVFFDIVKDSLIQGENAYFRGFGSFTLKKRAKKIGRNITKNTSIVVPEHYIPYFKPSKSFASKVKEMVKA
ncbi:MAG: integration host factor subunit beta [Bacteroidetes bacterium]|nr:integration host factor subunit beta [Bacteroidota bacterium]MBT5528163.1 integration host factor subunit beta [Cytophagia bacterium]MBT3424728.1 integration host factor subunit beta [Bacteroidota bacterium]MBT3800528.1 integration host factor subunit beta [Bacteroidota bacterium]MBT3935527.1 integration host factor subunit beta [Bacteroidota bacterium]